MQTEHLLRNAAVRTFCQRQPDKENCAAFGCAFNADLTAVALDDLLDNGQAETSAAAWLFGGEERFENVGKSFRGDAGAFVSNAKHGVIVL